MTTEELAQVWIPVSLRTRHVIAGDVFVGKDGGLWHVTKSGATTDGTWALVVDQGDYVTGGGMDPDDVIDVLVPALERDAVELTREELGARLVARRTTEQE